MFLTNITSLFIGLCGQAMIGHISIEAFAAVGIISTLINSLTGVLGATSVALNIVGATYEGKGDKQRLHEQVSFHLFLNLLMGIVFFLLSFCFANTLLKNFFHLDNTMLSESSRYFVIFSTSIGLNLLLFTCSAYLKIQHQTIYILVGSITASILNIIFDYIFIFGHFGFPEMGMQGNAIGSVLALFINLVFYLVVLKDIRLVFLPFKTFTRMLERMIKISAPIAGQEFLESTIFIFLINSLLVRIGLLETATYNLLFSIIEIILMPMHAYAQASLTFVSEEYTKENKKLMQLIPSQCTKMAIYFYISLAITFFLFKNNIIMLLTNQTALIEKAITFLPFVLIVYLFHIPATIYKSSLQAIGKETWIFAIFFLLNVLVMIGMSTLTIIYHYGLLAIYASLFLSHCVLTFLFIKKYRTCY